jgi:RNA polymerase sigma-70 factor (ECF subfamily)
MVRALNSKEQSDDELVAASLNGDKLAFAELVRRYETRIRSFCQQMLRNRALAEDVAQDTFLKAYDKLASFRNDSSFSTWLYRIASNRCIDECRKQKRRSFFGLEDLREEPSAAPRSEALESREQLRLILSGLSDEYRSLLLLRESEGLSYAQLAETLGCSIEAIRSKLKRARQKAVQIRNSLRRELQKEVD